MSTLLAELVRRQTTSSVVSVLGRTIDQIAAEIVHDLLRDPDFRAEMQQLMRLALQQAVRDFNEPMPSENELRELRERK
jgi:hypothetical protein